MSRSLLVAAVLLGVVACASAQQGCCLPSVFAVNTTRVSTLPHNSAVAGLNVGVFAVDLTNKMAFSSVKNFTSAPVNTWFKGSEGYVIVSGKCFNFPAPSTLMNPDEYCIGPASNFPHYAASVTVGEDTTVESWGNDEGTYVTVNTADCMPFATAAAGWLSADFDYTTTFDRQVFNLPTACQGMPAKVSVRHLAEEMGVDVSVHFQQAGVFGV